MKVRCAGSTQNERESLCRVISGSSSEQSCDLYLLPTKIFVRLEFAISLQMTTLCAEKELMKVQSSCSSCAMKRTGLLRGCEVGVAVTGMERAILRDLESRIIRSSPLLIKMASMAAELDCLLAFTSIAKECKYSRPKLVQQNILTIKNGRHPLQELVLDTFVPNDTDCTSEGHVNVITGPNYSGKSVYVKQVALIAFLSHLGSFVPAEQATIGLIDRIFSGVACKHTLTIQESTFMMDLHQVSIMLRNSTEKSLCILDEFGKGTLTTDGIGLLCSTLEYFARSPHAPKMFACTHFSEVFDEFFLSKFKNIQYFTMSVLESNGGNEGELQDIIFLYRLVPGKVLPSYGLKCAETAGVPQLIIDRANEIVGFIQEGKAIERTQRNEMNTKDDYYKGLVEKLLDFDCRNGDLDIFLKDVFTFESA